MDEIKAHTKHGDISLDQLAEIQPGLARLMDEISRRYTHLYRAAKGGNWLLAAHELNQIKGIFRVAKVTRPKYGEDLTSFESKFLDQLFQLVKQKDWSKFEELYEKSIEKSDEYHEKYGYGYIHFLLTEDESSFLYYGPAEKFTRKSIQKKRER